MLFKNIFEFFHIFVFFGKNSTNSSYGCSRPLEDGMRYLSFGTKSTVFIMQGEGVFADKG